MSTGRMGSFERDVLARREKERESWGPPASERGASSREVKLMERVRVWKRERWG